MEDNDIEEIEEMVKEINNWTADLQAYELLHEAEDDELRDKLLSKINALVNILILNHSFSEQEGESIFTMCALCAKAGYKIGREYMELPKAFKDIVK